MVKSLNQKMHEKKRFGKEDKEFNFKYIQFEGPIGYLYEDTQSNIILKLGGEVGPTIVKICRFMNHCCWGHHRRASVWMEKYQALL